MLKSSTRLCLRILVIVSVILCGAKLSATPVILKGQITMMDANGQPTTAGLPATVVLKYAADENFTQVSTIAKDGSFSFTVDVAKAGLYNMRFVRSSYDVMLSANEKETDVFIKLDHEQLKDISLKSPENDAYKTFRSVLNLYDTKIRSNFVDCDKEDSCEKALNGLLTEFEHELGIIQKNFKGTYTADVLCHMRMPVVAKSAKNTSSEFRKGFFENVPFSDTTIFNTSIFKEMITEYVDFVKEPTLSKESQFITYFTDKIKANPVVLHKSAGLLFEQLLSNKAEKMMEMFITWYNTGNNKELADNSVLDYRLKNISRVMPGQPFTDASCPDTAGTIRSLKEVVDKSKCTLLLFWSSECPHCRDEMPFIKEYYEKYHSKGFNVYAISLEPNPEKWKKFITDKGLPWTNVICGPATNPNPAIAYMSTSTPTMVLINSKGVIMHRFIPKNKLEQHIIECLR